MGISQFDFNDTTPAAPAGAILAGFQKSDNLDTEVRSISMTVPIATNGALGVVQPDGNTTTVDASGKIAAIVASADTPGIVQPDGKTLTVNSGGEISAVAATLNSPGIVQPDGTTITVNNGKISAIGSSGGSGGSTSVLFGTTDPNGEDATHIQSNEGTGVSVAFAANCTEGNLLICAFHTQEAPSATTIKDSLGTTFTLVAQQAAPSGHNDVCVGIYAGIAPSGGSNTITLSGTSGYSQIIISEFSNVTATVDTQSASYATDTPLAFDLTTTEPDLIYAYLATWDSGIGYQAGTGFTLAAQCSTNPCDAAEYQIAGAGTYSIDFTPSGGLDQAMIAVAFKVVVGSPVGGSEGDIYFNTSTSPYAGYVFHNDAWNPFN